MTVNRGKPIPEMSPQTKRYWELIQEKKLSVPRCRTCGKYVFYPKSWCPDCFSTTLDWVEISGRGKILTFTVVHQAPFESYKEFTPYVIAVVKLEEGVQMMANIVHTDIAKIHIGMEVKVVFEERDRNGDKFLVPQFEGN